MRLVSPARVASTITAPVIPVSKIMNRLFDYIEQHPIWTCIIIGVLADGISEVIKAVSHLVR